jgi:predicted 3-demethylubiquinone-9 3-methyltransferase (glyoxalase superfamily)
VGFPAFGALVAQFSFPAIQGETISADPESEQCGWLKDKFGVSWQIVPSALHEMIQHGTPEQIARITRAFLKMTKFDLAALRRAHDAQ